ncbi:hypothetical protein PAHAL_3G227000 [Panicum hallii]|uniref:Glycine-rich protein n=1 Tax=Panicum hallii TaxID=206008 RepID=A0A2S3HAR8_9POAL|nr:hypothetical protein PAHAL_3G227000 [Panicum hallii]
MRVLACCALDMALPSRGPSVLLQLLLAGLALAAAFSCADTARAPAAHEEGKATAPEVSDALPVELPHVDVIDKFGGGHGGGGGGGGHAGGGGGGHASGEGGRAHSSGAGRGGAGPGAGARAAAAGAATGNRRRSAAAGASERGAWKAAGAGAALAAALIAVCR